MRVVAIGKQAGIHFFLDCVLFLRWSLRNFGGPWLGGLALSKATLALGFRPARRGPTLGATACVGGGGAGVRSRSPRGGPWLGGLALSKAMIDT